MTARLLGTCSQLLLQFHHHLLEWCMVAINSSHRFSLSYNLETSAARSSSWRTILFRALLMNASLARICSCASFCSRFIAEMRVSISIPLESPIAAMAAPTWPLCPALRQPWHLDPRTDATSCSRTRFNTLAISVLATNSSGQSAARTASKLRAFAENGESAARANDQQVGVRPRTRCCGFSCPISHSLPLHGTWTWATNDLEPTCWYGECVPSLRPITSRF